MSTASPLEQQIDGALVQHFGFQNFRKGQRDIISSVLARKDVLAVMPTGRGKSLCYQLPAVMQPGIVLVISPLISLMEDQVKGLTRLGIACGCLHSGLALSQRKETFSTMRREKAFLLYLAAERIQKEGFMDWVKQAPLSLIAIDEAHCVSQWGPDFRKDYYRLALIRELRPDVPILALTATATPTVLKDIERQLKLNKAERHVHGFYRPNLYYQVEACANDEEKKLWVKEALAQFPEGRILIYCGTRRVCEELTQELETEFSGVGFYHAGMSPEERTAVQKNYETGKLRILAATNAFGMGIDHPDVRLVIHFQVPANIEGYYQEMGRAGRDEGPSTCLLLYAKKDKGLHSYFITKSEAEADVISRRWQALDNIIQYAEGGECRHSGILTYFRDTFRLKRCGHCDVCDPKSNRRVRLSERRFATAVPILKKTKTKKSRSAPDSRPLESDEELRYEYLRAWRKEYAEENDIPAFLVFSDKTLTDLVRKNPTTLTQLQGVYGFGEHKTQHLGPLVLEKLAECRG